MPGALETTAVLAGLPSPVARYFRFALAEHQTPVRQARVTHHGEMQLTPGQWHRFASVEYLTVRPPRFVWDARVRVAPMRSVHVREAYADGTASLRASASGVRTVLDRRGLPALAQAALQRWLGEAAVLPTALLPSSVLWWEPVDAHRARAWCADSGVTASLVFEFGARGEIVRCRGDRHRDTSDGPILTPWEGRFDCYGEANGMQIPRWSEAAWLGAPAAMPYWRARVRTTDYDFG